MLDSVIVVTDRRILDKQIRDTIKQFMQVSNTVAWAEHSGNLTKAITGGKRIIVTAIEKFPYIVPQIGADHKDNVLPLSLMKRTQAKVGEYGGRFP